MTKFFTGADGEVHPIRSSRGYSNRRAKMSRTKSSVFFPATSKTAAKHIHIDTMSNAQKSTDWLNVEYNSAKTHNRRVRLVRYADLAATRAKIVSRNERVSSGQRAEAARISEHYKGWANRHRTS